MVAAADGNPLLALESARAAARGDTGPPASLRGAVRAALATLDRARPRRRRGRRRRRPRPGPRRAVRPRRSPDAVSAAAESGLFRSADGRFGFRHALLREAVAADLDDTRRAALHETLGHALAASPAEAARHLRLAGRDDLAAARLARGRRGGHPRDRPARGGRLPAPRSSSWSTTRRPGCGSLRPSPCSAAASPRSRRSRPPGAHRTRPTTPAAPPPTPRRRAGSAARCATPAARSARQPGRARRPRRRPASPTPSCAPSCCSCARGAR